ncbi:MAG: hypothetical protein ACK5Z5_09990 [Neisseriaceae bacterium]
MFTSKNGNLIDVEELTWDRASNIIENVNPELVKIINKLSPDKELTLYKVRYPFGVKIMHNSESFLPLVDGGTISFNSPELPEKLLNNLGYDPATNGPLGILINKNCDLYMKSGTRIVPHLVLSPGEMVGTNRAINNALPYMSGEPLTPSPIWDLSSGSSLIFMLSKISDRLRHNKLQKYLGYDLEKPEQYNEHHIIFREIARLAKCNWYSEFIFFSNKWQSKLSDPACFQFAAHLLQLNRYLNRSWHNTPRWTMIFNDIEKKQKIDHLASYVLGTVRHLLSIAASCAPGFKPAVNDDSAPISNIQEIYLNIYELEDYWPIIMETAQFSPTYKQPIYYLINCPTLAQYNPETFKGKSIVQFEDIVRSSMDKYCDILRKEYIKDAPSLHKVASTIDFSYYHTDPNGYNMIANALELPDKDPRFMCEHKQGSIFPSHSSFLNGCVKISPKKTF